ncbi:MAG: ATP-binding domain-containing protein [Synechococcales cyanobacterium RU_4_20]|nr:ATP-binding domain-containing protein [Synechococcales cyanobacterium RU_4_20]
MLPWPRMQTAKKRKPGVADDAARLQGLEFPVVFLVGMEQGLFPSYRSIDDPSAIEEERRLCYVGITRAQEQLFITHANARRLWGSREPAMPSIFLGELPQELIQGDSVGLLGRRERVDQLAEKAERDRQTRNETRQAARTQAKVNAATVDWNVGDRVLHRSFGMGDITHVFGSGSKISIAIKFPNLGQKIFDPLLAPIEKV